MTGRLRAPLGALTLACLVMLAAPHPGGEAAPPEDGPARPNVLVVMTDDQTVEQMRALPRVRAQVGEQGATFVNSFVNYPLCCPSRATFLTGQYARNHRVLDNAGPIGGFDRLRSEEILPVWLQRRGYYTGQVGKYLNEYGADDPTLVPPGYSEWVATLAGSADDVYDYTLNENGALVDYGKEARDFKQDVITSKAVDFVRRRAPAAQPFYLFVGYTSPHHSGPSPNPQPPNDCDGLAAKPAPRHAGAFTSARPPQPPSYNEADIGDKPADIRSMSPIEPREEAGIAEGWRCGLRSLLSVDEGVAALLRTLREAGELDESLVVFTSDNGFFHGEHRIRRGKKRLYEEASRVPLMIRGPAIPAGTVVRDMVVNADLAPTILEATGAEPGVRIDGVSLFPFVEEPNSWRGRELLIESDTYRAIRTRRYIYAEHDSGGREMYDLDADPFQLESVHGDPRYRRERTALVARLRRLKRCEAAGCQRAPRLGLALRFPGGGPACRASAVKASVNRHGEAVDEVGFRVGARTAGVDRTAPFRHRFRLEGTERGVEALADLIDGRRMTLAEELPRCG